MAQLQHNATATQRMIDEEADSQVRHLNRDRWNSFPGEIRNDMYKLLTIARYGNKSLNKLLELRRVSKQWEQDTSKFFRNTVESRLSMNFTSPAPIDITRRIQNVKYGPFKALAFRNRFIIADMYNTKFYRICEFVEVFIRPSFLDELVPSPGRSPQSDQYRPGKYFPSSYSLPSYSFSTPCSAHNMADDEEEGDCTFKETIRYEIDLDEWNGADVMLEYKQQHIAEFFRGLQGVGIRLRKDGKSTNADISRAIFLFLGDTGSSPMQ